MIPNPLHAVIFDMDGTLLDTERVSRAAIRDACAEQGHELTDALFLTLVGLPREVNDRQLAEHFGADFDLMAYHASRARSFAAIMADAVPLRPGARVILAYLQGRAIPVGLATSTARSTVEAQLGSAGLLDYFDTIVTRDDVARGKPDPESYLRAAARLGALPSQCLAIEDSPIGVRAAASAGMATIMIPDLIAPLPEIEALCVGVEAGLNEVLAHLSSRDPRPMESDGTTL